MSNSQTQIDEIVLDELASGNLRGEEYRKVLRALESEPDRWKDCALAFLEHQAFKQELSALASSRTPWQLDVKEPIEQTVLPETPPSTKQLRSASRLEWMHRFTSIAALLLISFTIGWFGSGLRRNTPNIQQPSDGQLASNDDPIIPPAGSPPISPPISPQGGGMQFAGNPVVSVDRQKPEVLREMERLGRADIETYEVYMPVRLEDGSTAIVPVQKYRIKPKVFSY